MVHLNREKRGFSSVMFSSCGLIRGCRNPFTYLFRTQFHFFMGGGRKEGYQSLPKVKERDCTSLVGKPMGLCDGSESRGQVQINAMISHFSTV